MKKIKFLLLGCLLIILTTGCVKFNANMNIKKDKSMDFTITYALDKSIFGDQESIKESDFEEAKKEGFTVSKYSEGNMEGVTLTRKVNNIDEVSTEDDAEYDLSGMLNNKEGKYLFKVVKGTDKNTYYAKFKFDSNDSGLNMTEDEDLDLDNAEEVLDNEETSPDETDNLETTGEADGNDIFGGMDLEKMTANMDLSFSVTLPNSAISNNATKAEDDNKKLSWSLTTTGEQAIEFAFELSNNTGSNDMILYIGIGVIAVLVIVVIILALSKKKDSKFVVAPTVENNSVENNVDENQSVNEVKNEESNNQ